MNICEADDNAANVDPPSGETPKRLQNPALPTGATVGPDGGVILRLDHPFALEPTGMRNDTKRVDRFDELVFRRLHGSDVRKILAAPDGDRRALALSLSVSPVKLVLIQAKIDAGDRSKANNIVQSLLGGLKLALPSNAEQTPRGIVLRLRRPVVNTAKGPVSELHFARLTAAQRDAVLNSPSVMDWGLGTATGISPKAAKALIDQMDGADAMDVNMIVLGLCGSRKVFS